MAKKNVSQFGRDKALDRIIGANVKRIRAQRGLTQEALSKLLGPGTPVTFQQVQKYEKGTNSIAACRVPYFCRALGITLEQLFEGTMEIASKPEALHSLSQRAVKVAENFDKLDDAVAGRIADLVGSMATLDQH